jgi:hypothetical protein
LIGGIGTLAGLITGIVKAVKAGQSAAPASTAALGVLAACVRVLVLVIAYTLGGLLIGAAVGFGMDQLFVF